jgi:TetR/AcrR family transcriptional repressor of nem operon
MFKTTGHIGCMAKPNLREAILSAGLETLHLKGFNATSVQDIADAAGAPKGSFYNHFASKDDLGAAAVDKYVVNTEAYRRILRDETVAPLARLRGHFVALVEAARHPYALGCLLGNFGVELSNQSPAIRERVAAALTGWAQALAAVIAEAQREGALPCDGEPNAMAAFVIDAWEGAVMRAKVERSRAPLDNFLTMVFSKVLV